MMTKYLLIFILILPQSIGFAGEILKEKKTDWFISIDLGIPYMIFKDGLKSITDNEDRKFFISGAFSIKKGISEHLIIGPSIDLFFHYSSWNGQGGTGIMAEFYNLHGRYYINHLLNGIYFDLKIGASLFQTCITSKIGLGLQGGTGYSIPIKNYAVNIGFSYTYLEVKNEPNPLVTHIMNLYFGFIF